MRAASFFFALLFLTSAALAQVADVPATEPAAEEGAIALSTDQAKILARRALATGNFVVADAISSAILSETPDDAEMLLVRAILARRAGATEIARETAAEAYANADSDAIRFDAAFLNAELLARDERFLRSEFWLRRADQAARTDAQRTAVERAFRQVNLRNPLNIRFRFSINPSNNVNNGAEELEIEIGGLPFRLSDDAQALSGVEASAGVSLSYRLSENPEQRTEALLDLFYRKVWLDSEAEELAPDAEDSDFDYGAVVAGLRHQRLIWPDLGTSSVTGLVGRSWYGGDPLARWYELTLRQNVGLASGPLLTFGLTARTEDRLDDPINDSKSLAISIDLRQAVPGSGSFGIGATLRNVWSDSATVDQIAAAIRVDRSFAQIGPVQPRVGLTLEDRDYRSFTSVEGGRDDQSVALSLQATFPDVRLYGFIPEATLRARRTFSTVDIYDRDELTFGITAVSRF